MSKYLNLKSKESILKLKKKISKTTNNIYFETRKIENLEKIEYRIRKSYPLSEIPDTKPYEEYLMKAGKSLSTQFKNLSGDTILVIPTKHYSNIYQFAKNSTDKEFLALFRRVVKNFKKGDYISTHGHGVSYLHIRIETYPKYYTPF